MSILQELLSLREAPEVPVELKDIIAAFPKHHGKAIEKLWGGKRLVWHGMRFFEDGELGDAYVKAEAAAEAYINDGYNTDVNMTMHAAPGLETVDDKEEEDFTYDVEFGDLHGGERQECYLGYDPVNDKLYIGFDAWVSEDDFNDATDKAFEELTGESMDLDDEAHSKTFHDVHDEWKNEGFGFWGLIFEISHYDGEDFEAEEAFPPMPGGFYKGMYREFKRTHPKVIDLRLD